MTRTFLIHLNVEVPDKFADQTPDEIADKVITAATDGLYYEVQEYTIVCPLAEDIS